MTQALGRRVNLLSSMHVMEQKTCVIDGRHLQEQLPLAARLLQGLQGKLLGGT